MAGHRIIYDFGMNNGDDIEYYLKKGFKVVGVDGNPELCKACSTRFEQQIASGDLHIVNAALSQTSSIKSTRFYIHKTNHVLSRILPPPQETACDYIKIFVPQRKASEVVQEYGEAHYIKIDVEHFDPKVVADLFGASIFPTFISAELHSIDVFWLLVAHGYTSFNLVEGRSVSSKYKSTHIQTPNGRQTFSFKQHSAGPFGEDITTPWMTKEAFFRFLQLKHLGWKDIHATMRMASHK